MSRKLYVGNLPYSLDSEGLEDIFSGVGKVANARVIFDRLTNKSKGFGFIEMDNESLAAEAIEKLNDMEVGGRKLKISFAREPGRSASSEAVLDYR